MIKDAQTDHEIHELIKRRWSPRSFAERKVEREKMMSLFEAARWASSAHNEQPWRFVFAPKDNAERYEKFLGCVNENNRIWISTAPLLIMAVIRNEMVRDNLPNRHAMHDLGLATGGIMVEATALDLYVHVIGGFDSEQARAVAQIPAAYTPVTMMAVGYLGKPEALPEKFKALETSPRTRKKVEEFAFEGLFKA